MIRKAGVVTLSLVILFLSLFNVALAQLEPESLRQIELLIQEKQSRTPAQQKIQSQLLQAVRESRGKQMVEGLHLKPAKVNADEKGNLQVDISATVTDELIKKIEALGGAIIYPSKEYNTIRAQVNLAIIDTLSTYPEIKYIEPAVHAKIVGSGFLGKTIVSPGKDSLLNVQSSINNLSEHTERVKKILEKYMEDHRMLTTDKNSPDIINSEGDHTHGADKARNVYGYTGKGIKVGVLSDSYNSTGGAIYDVIDGQLPGPANPYGYATPVTIVKDYSGGTDEGRAMLQIVHDIAPGAQLYFATGNISEASFAANIKALRNAPYSCDIILDDLGYFDEPVFQDGTIAQAVDYVISSGGLYFSAAGNEGSLAKGTSGVFEGDFNSTGSATFSTSKAGTIHNFGTISSPVNGDIITNAGGEYILNWSDPWGASSNDYDLFLVSASGTVEASSTNVQNGTQNPYESITPPTTLNPGDRLVVFKTSAAAVRAFSLNTLGGTLAVATTGQTHGHCCAIGAFGVAATPAYIPFGPGSPTGPFPGVFNTSNQVELFSSDGPRRVFYNSSGTAITPGNLLFSTNGGTILQKPDITAADGVSTNVSNTSIFTPFFGTSAATPHAAGIAALIKSANPALTQAQIRTILTSTALDIESSGVDINSGYGIVQAYQAMQAVSPTLQSNINLDTVNITEGAFSNGNGAIDPGETGVISVQLTDSALVAATNVTSSIKTTTAGVTILQGTASYGTIAPSGTATNTFTFSVSTSVPCGTVITFFDTVYFSGGPSPQIFMFTANVGSQPDMNISSNLGSTPPTGNNFTSSTGTQTDRINRNTVGEVSTCATPLTNPGLLAGSTAARTYDAYKFTNTSSVSQCITVTMSSVKADSLFSVTYNDTGFVPSNPSLHFLADGGNSYSPEQYTFTAPAGQPFTVVVLGVDPGGEIGTPYNLDISLSQCTIVYTFNGNGNWSDSSNWVSSNVPPATLPSGAEILIDPVSTGECVLDITETISAGGIITVQSGKKFRILNDLKIQ